MTMLLAALMVLSMVPTGGVLHTAMATTSLADMRATNLAADADTTPPVVISTIPANAATHVATNSAISVTFSEVMNATTFNTTTFTLRQGITLVSGAVTYSGIVATFTPATNLSASMVYNATITTGAKDLAGNPLASNHTWTFTTGAAPRLPVNLLSAGDFVILAKSGISTTGTTRIIGDIGVSPIGFTAITGFGLTMDASNQFSRSSLVVGKVYAANYAPPTPAKMTAAVSAMEAAYTDAAGRSIPDYTDLGAGNIGGMTLYPGLYKWSTGVTIPTDVILSGNANDVWIFQIAQTLGISNGIHILLSGGAQAKNIFWQVAGQTTLGTTSVFNGNILCLTQIVLNTGSTLNGRALAQTAVTCDANTITIPANDVSAPRVSSTIPVNHATGVAINSAMSATFSEAMNPTTITTATFTLENGTMPVPGVVTYAGITALFTPASSLSTSTIYTATITTGAEDLAGNPLASNYTWTFTTGAAPDLIAPTVSSTIPVNHATGVAINSAMSATFSEAMNPTTITTATFTLENGTTPVPGAVTYAGITATFTPTINLAYNTTYTATITTGATDLSNNPLASNYTWTFTTGAAPDIVAPTVSSTIPVNHATGVAINSAMSATFSEAMNPTTITTATFTLKHGAAIILGTVTYVGITATFTPLSDLAVSTVGINEYMATITTGATDLSGNPLASNYTWTFTTGAAPDIIAPTVSSTIPTSNATGVAVNSNMSATFSEAMNPTTITTDTFTLKHGATNVLGTVTYIGLTAVFNPVNILQASTVYTATINTGAKDLAGNPLASNYTWAFATGMVPDIIAPSVAHTVPVNHATGVAVNSAMSATFSEAMNPITITTATFTLKHGAAIILGTVIYSVVTATFTPAGNLSTSTVYTATITTGAKDLAGNPLASDYVWTFTTGAAPDIVAPTVTHIVPTNAATGVAINSAISATFSEAMNPLTITTVTFALKHGATPVIGTVTYSGITALFTPASDLSTSTVYTATITTGVEDLAGNPLASNFMWTFTTGAAPDIVAPTVTHIVPTNAATGVATNSAISATFSEAMNPLTITTVTFVLKHGATPVTGTVIYSGITAVFTPATNLSASMVYNATITTGAKDLAGNPLASNYTWTFTTSTGPDLIAPTVSSTIPANHATGVAINSAMSATFSEAMNPTTITITTFILKLGAATVLGAVTYSEDIATFAPANDLAYNTTYTATITTGATDLSNNPLASNYTWTFTTGAAPDIVAPTVTNTVPINAATGVAINSAMSVTFSEAMNTSTITNVTFVLKQGGTPVTGTVTYSGVTAIFTPAGDLAYNTTYTATITTGAKDLAGNPLTSNHTWTFTTGEAPASEGFPLWALILIVVVIAAVAIGLVYWLVRRPSR